MEKELKISSEVLNYFNGDKLAASSWIKKYALKDENGDLIEKTPDDMHKRMAKEFAKIESKYEWKQASPSFNLSNYGYNRFPLSEEEIYDLFAHFKYIIPAGSVMYGLGNPKPVSLSNCFVIDSPKDSITGIFKTCSEQASLFKRRGGVGFDISTLRPNQAKVNNSAHFSTGSVSFMDLFSQVTNTIGEHNRRGALMISISINHPDIFEFITKKQDLTKVTGANVSVKITDEFMQAVENDEDYLLRFPIDLDIHSCRDKDYSFYEYNKLYCVNEEKNIYIKRIKAKELWNTLIHCAWNTAEPGIIFEDTMINYAPDGVYPNFKMVSTNPCAEIAMEPYNSCRLMHINLTSVIEKPFTKDAKLDDELLYKLAYEATVLGDDLIDLEIEAVNNIIKVIEEKGDKEELELWKNINNEAIKTRRCGVGFTALSDMIAMLGEKYGSDKSLQIIENVMRIIFLAQLDATIDLAIKRGKFEGYSKELESKGNDWYNFIKNNFPTHYNKMMQFGRRNLSFSTVAPTGTVSLMAQTSTGIEPLFMPYYIRKVKCMSNTDRVDSTDVVGLNYTHFVVVHPTLRKWIEAQDNSIIVDLLSPEEMDVWFKKSPWYQSIAPEISWKRRIEIQSICQKYTTHSISSTINLPKETTEQEIADIYLQAWKSKNKGQTVYRDGCRDGVLVNIKNEKPKEIIDSKAPKRPKELEAEYHEIKSKGRRFAIIVGLYDNKPYEIFAFELDNEQPILKQHKGKNIKIGKMHYRFVSEFTTIKNLQLRNENVEEKAATLYASMLLRHGVNIKYIVKTAKKVNENITSFTSAICRVLSKYMENETIQGEVCPECGSKLIREGGCIRCSECSYSKCL